MIIELSVAGQIVETRKENVLPLVDNLVEPNNEVRTFLLPQAFSGEAMEVYEIHVSKEAQMSQEDYARSLANKASGDLMAFSRISSIISTPHRRDTLYVLAANRAQVNRMAGQPVNSPLRRILQKSSVLTDKGPLTHLEPGAILAATIPDTITTNRTETYAVLLDPCVKDPYHLKVLLLLPVNGKLSLFDIDMVTDVFDPEERRVLGREPYRFCFHQPGLEPVTFTGGLLETNLNIKFLSLAPHAPSAEIFDLITAHTPLCITRMILNVRKRESDLLSKPPIHSSCLVQGGNTCGLVGLITGTQLDDNKVYFLVETKDANDSIANFCVPPGYVNISGFGLGSPIHALNKQGQVSLGWYLKRESGRGRIRLYDILR